VVRKYQVGWLQGNYKGEVVSLTRERVIEINEIAQKDFSDFLEFDSPQQDAAIGYLGGRGITKMIAREFGLGYASCGYDFFNPKYSMLEVIEAGLKNERGHPRFRNRLMMPIHDEFGDLVAFGGRAMRDDQQPKYLNSPETAAYSKRKVLYNLHRATDVIKEDECAILVEGYMDVISLHKAGFKNVVASCGTSLTEEQVSLLDSRCGQVFINFDSDKAGIEATLRSALLLIERDMDVRVVVLNGAKDPDEFVRKYGKDSYRRAIQNARTFLQWAVRTSRMTYDMDTVTGRAECLDWLLPILATVCRNSSNMEMFCHLAEALGVPAKTLAAAMDKTPKPPVITYDQANLSESLSLASKLS
jgi:DNA primase